MQTPTISELQTAIEVLKELGERINTDAAHTLIQLPETRQGDDYAARVQVRTIERMSHVEIVGTQLENWRNELNETEKKSDSREAK